MYVRAGRPTFARPCVGVHKSTSLMSSSLLLSKCMYSMKIDIEIENIFDYSHSFYRLVGQVGRLFANGSGDQGSVPGRIIPKTLKMVLS